MHVIRLMTPEEIGKAYDQIIHLWQSKDFDRSNGIKQHQQAIKFVQSRGSALDVGCGLTGRLIDVLLDHGFAAEGLDISSEMLRFARQKHPELFFHHADICQWQLPKKYDFISAWDSIWHVPLDHHEQVLAKLLSGLNLGGVCLFSCGGLDEAGEHTDSTMGPEVYYSSLGINGFLEVIAQADCVCRHFQYDQYPELYAYFIVQKVS